MEDVASKCGAGERGRGEAGGVSEFGFWLRGKEREGVGVHALHFAPFIEAGERLTELPRTRTGQDVDLGLGLGLEAESSRVRTVESLFGCHPGELGRSTFCASPGLVVESRREVVVLGGFGSGISNGWE